MRIDRLPAVPLIASDPYISVWMPSDSMCVSDTIHWCGPQKPIRGTMTVDGKTASFLGHNRGYEAELTELIVTPTATLFTSEFGGVKLETRFVTPALPDDLDRLSMPVTLVDFNLSSTDGKRHDVRLFLFVSDSLCYDGNIRPKMFCDGYRLGNLNVVWHGQAVQKPLGHSGDRICIDWGYLYLASSAPVESCNDGPRMCWTGSVAICARRGTAETARRSLTPSLPPSHSLTISSPAAKCWTKASSPTQEKSARIIRRLSAPRGGRLSQPTSSSPRRTDA